MEYASSLREGQAVKRRIFCRNGQKEDFLLNGRVVDAKGKVSTANIYEVLSSTQKL